jgi:hypothetical protein
MFEPHESASVTMLEQRSLDRALASVWCGTAADSACLPAQGVDTKELISPAVCAVLVKSRWMPRF